MHNITFLDSGIGGMTVLGALSRAANLNLIESSHLLHPEMLYFADLENMPYGNKSLMDLRYILDKNLERISSIRLQRVKRIDTVILACNTISLALTPQIRNKYKHLQIISILDVADLLLHRLREKRLKKIAIFSTTATHTMGAYMHRCQRILGEDVVVQSIPCPELAVFIEENLYNFHAPQVLARANKIVQSCVSHLDIEPEAYILGCTHYPIVGNIFKKHIPNSELVDPAEGLLEYLNLCQIALEQTYNFNSVSTAYSEDFAYRTRLLHQANAV